MPFCTNGIATFQLLVNREITSLDDLEGLKVRANGGSADVAASLGMVPVNVPVPEIRTMLEQGALDGVISAYPLLNVQQVEEFARFAVELDFGAGGQSLGMSLSTWEALPTDIQSIISQVSDESVAAMASIYESGMSVDRDELVARGLVISQPPPDVYEAMTEAVVFAQENWVTGLEAAGNGEARAVLEEFKRLIEVYETADSSD